MKYEEKLRINYNKFTHEGKTPFVNLIDSDCVKLMTKKVQNIVWVVLFDKYLLDLELIFIKYNLNFSSC